MTSALGWRGVRVSRPICYPGRGTYVAVCKVQRPNPRAGADVKDTSGVVADWGEEQLVVERHQEYVVL